MCADAVEWLRMESRGLQNRCRGGFPFLGGFDSPHSRHDDGLLNEQCPRPLL